jgi:hypothetical protein
MQTPCKLRCNHQQGLVLFLTIGHLARLSDRGRPPLRDASNYSQLFAISHVDSQHRCAERGLWIVSALFVVKTETQICERLRKICAYFDREKAKDCERFAELFACSAFQSPCLKAFLASAFDGRRNDFSRADKGSQFRPYPILRPVVIKQAVEVSYAHRSSGECVYNSFGVWITGRSAEDATNRSLAVIPKSKCGLQVLGANFTGAVKQGV